MNDLEFGIGVYPTPVPQEWYTTQLLQTPIEPEQEITEFVAESGYYVNTAQEAANHTILTI